MTIRAAILGVLFGALIAGFGYLNDAIFRLNMIVGNHLPISVFGVLVVVSLGLNPLLRRLPGRWSLRPGELAVVTALTLVGCCIPGSGLMREFTQIMALPAHYNRLEAGWRENRVISHAPEPWLLAQGEYDEAAHGDYLNGVEATGENRILYPTAVPWRAWMSPLAAWLPIILLTYGAVFCLSLIVHPQWSRRELLAYPMVLFARSVISGRTGRHGVPLVRASGFWWGLGIIFAIRLVNGLHTYYPESFIPVRLSFNFIPLTELWPELRRAPGWWALFQPRLYPTAVALAFFLAADVSLSLGLTQWIAIPVLALLTGYGLNLQPGQMGTGLISWQMFGSYLAMSGIIGYMGRHYYWHVLRAAVAGRRAQPVAEGYAVWACRALLGIVAVLVVLLSLAGLAWQFALLLTGLMLMMFVVVARVSAEAGLPHIETNWNALGVIGGLFGTAALGPAALVAIGLVCAMLMVDVREALMPFVVNGMKLAEEEGERPHHAASAGVLVFGIGLALAIPVVLTAQYTCGVPLVDGWGSRAVPRFAFDRLNDALYHLQATGELAAAESMGTWQRFAAMAPRDGFLWAVGIGAVLVLVCSTLRLRWTRWPLHPVIFLTWTTWPLMAFSHSFLLGWLLKKVTMRFGGERLFQRLLPTMVGVIAGDLLGGLVFMVVGAIYYTVTGTPAPGYRVFPG